METGRDERPELDRRSFANASNASNSSAPGGPLGGKGGTEDIDGIDGTEDIDDISASVMEVDTPPVWPLCAEFPGPTWPT